MKIITWNVQWFCGLDGVVDVARVVDAARAMADFDLDPVATLMIGDHERDVEAARRAGVSGILYSGGSLLETLRKGLASLG